MSSTGPRLHIASFFVLASFFCASLSLAADSEGPSATPAGEWSFRPCPTTTCRPLAIAGWQLDYGLRPRRATIVSVSGMHERIRG